MKKILMTLTLALGAMIAIPAAAQSTATTATEQAKECCKEKKTCAKECEKTCAKAEGKALKGERKMKDGQIAKGDRKMKSPKNARMGKANRKGGENLMMKGITLTEEQKAKFQALREKSKEAMKSAKAEAKTKSKDEMQKLRADFDKEVEKILDKDQLKQYQANKAEMEARRAEKKKS